MAGPVLAFWLHRFGFEPTVVERTPELRLGGGGHAVDLFGPAVDLMEWMGALDEVKAARTQTRVIALIRPGRRPVNAPAEALLGRRLRAVTSRSCAATWPELSTRAAVSTWSTSSTTRSRRLNDTGSQIEVGFERGSSRNTTSS